MTETGSGQTCARQKGGGRKEGRAHTEELLKLATTHMTVGGGEIIGREAFSLSQTKPDYLRNNPPHTLTQTFVGTLCRRSSPRPVVVKRKALLTVNPKGIVFTTARQFSIFVLRTLTCVAVTLAPARREQASDKRYILCPEHVQALPHGHKTSSLPRKEGLPGLDWKPLCH